jgi:hypothetical protein
MGDNLVWNQVAQDTVKYVAFKNGKTLCDFTNVGNCSNYLVSNEEIEPRA